VSQAAGQLAVQLSVSGLMMHLINDQLITWGRCAQPNA
jgi:hypothetical protein